MKDKIERLNQGRIGGGGGVELNQGKKKIMGHRLEMRQNVIPLSRL